MLSFFLCEHTAHNEYNLIRLDHFSQQTCEVIAGEAQVYLITLIINVRISSVY